jgi:hypothetical protein
MLINSATNTLVVAIETPSSIGGWISSIVAALLALGVIVVILAIAIGSFGEEEGWIGLLIFAVIGVLIYLAVTQ